jgi:bifunctional non-homologous end joining protein LigD
MSRAPLPDFVESMKAQLVDSTQPGDWIYEIKFDGFRALALRGAVKRASYHGPKGSWKEVHKHNSSIAALDAKDAVIDGEIVALDDKGRPSFQLLQGFDIGLARPPIVFYAFRFAAA